MSVSLKYCIKEWTGGSQDHLVCFHLLTILTGQGHISKVIVLSQVSKGNFDVVLEVVPLEAKFFRHFVATQLIEHKLNMFGSHIYKRVNLDGKVLKDQFGWEI